MNNFCGRVYAIILTRGRSYAMVWYTSRFLDCSYYRVWLSHFSFSLSCRSTLLYNPYSPNLQYQSIPRRRIKSSRTLQKKVPYCQIYHRSYKIMPAHKINRKHKIDILTFLSTVNIFPEVSNSRYLRFNL